jgi:YD repeat-containing protein
MHRTILAGLLTAALLSACGGGGGTGGAPAQAAATLTYRFVPPQAGAHLVYADQQVDTLNNTLNRTAVDDVTAVNTDGTFAVHEEDPSHNRVVSGAIDETLYPTDFQYDAAGQVTAMTVTKGTTVTHCTYQGSQGAPATLAVGAGWNTQYTETCDGGPGVAYTQNGTLAGIETITVAAGTFSAYRIVSTTTWTVNGITRTETATRWRDASGGDTRTLKMVRAIAYSGGTPAAGALVTASRELQSYR